jgi:hypothetical protein
MSKLTPEQLKTFAANHVVEDKQDDEPQQTLTAEEQRAVAKVNAETQALMQMKAALMETGASRGWAYVEKFAETIVRNLEQAAIAEEDDTKANGLRRDARGARKFKDELFKRIAMAKSQEIPNFLEVVTD